MTQEVNIGFVPQLSLAQRLRIAREVTGLDQRDFADELGLTRQSVSAAEKGHSTPRELTLRAWSMRTGVSLHWIKTGEAPPPSGDGASGLSLLSESNRRPFHYRSDNRTRLASA